MTFVSGEKWNYNWTSGDVSPASGLPAHLLEALNREFIEYIKWWNEHFFALENEAGYKVSTPTFCLDMKTDSDRTALLKSSR